MDHSTIVLDNERSQRLFSFYRDSGYQRGAVAALLAYKAVIHGSDRQWSWVALYVVLSVAWFPLHAVLERFFLDRKVKALARETTLAPGDGRWT